MKRGKWAAIALAVLLLAGAGFAVFTAQRIEQREQALYEVCLFENEAGSFYPETPLDQAIEVAEDCAAE